MDLDWEEGVPREKTAYPGGDPKLKHWATSPFLWVVWMPGLKAQAYLRSKNNSKGKNNDKSEDNDTGRKNSLRLTF